MVAKVQTVAFEGMKARAVDVQVQIAGGLPSFTVVGLPDKAVAESRERVRAALGAVGLGLPPKRITVNLAPANLPKEGSHYDLPIALGLMAASGALEGADLQHWVVLGELGLDGGIGATRGALPAAMYAMEHGFSLVCPHASGAEAAWSGLGQRETAGELVAPAHLLELVNHLRGRQMLAPPKPGALHRGHAGVDMAQVRGQESARRALEIAAAGGHNMLMVGAPGVGKSMLAACLPGILPPLDTRGILEVSMVASMAGTLEDGAVSSCRPYRAPHHTASVPAMVGGGKWVRPGEVSLAHEGVLFLDEVAEFPRGVLEALRQPLESGEVSVARASGHVVYPARVQLVAAMNPCRCGWASEPDRACGRVARCVEDYRARLSGPFLDRMDMRVNMATVLPHELSGLEGGEPSAEVAKRVTAARDVQMKRWGRVNAHVQGEDILECVNTDARVLLEQTASRQKFSVRGFFRVLKVARTIADLEGSENVHRHHVGEALATRSESIRNGAGEVAKLQARVVVPMS